MYSKKIFGDVAGDRRLDSSEDNLRVMVFLPVIDTAILQLQERFKGLLFKGLFEVTKRFEFLVPHNILSFSEEDITKAS